MATAKPPASQRVAESFRRLAHSSKNLEVAVDEWKTYIDALNKALQKLHLGVSAWHRIAGGGDDAHTQWWTREIGYTQINHEWCIALRRSWGHHDFTELDAEETWRLRNHRGG